MLYFRSWISEDKKEAHQKAHMAALSVLQCGLMKEYGLTTLPEIRCDAYGKPAFKDLPDIRFNYSHCKNMIICAITEDEIGVDIESSDRPVRDSLIAHTCSPSETVYVREQEDRSRAFLRLWVAKEAYLKCIGTGIRSDLKQLDMSLIARSGAGIYQDHYLYIEETADYVYAVCRENTESETKLELCYV